MRLKIAAAVAAIGLGFAGAALGMDSNMSAADAISARQDIMKFNSDTFEVLVPMAKGEVPLDPAAAQQAFATIKANYEKLPSLFPDDSMEGGNTRALPAVWENKADFDAKAAKMAADAGAAEQAAAQGQEAFAAALQQVGSNCGGCHELYRGPAS
jgi:cytochrome c556